MSHGKPLELQIKGTTKATIFNNVLACIRETGDTKTLINSQWCEVQLNVIQFHILQKREQGARSNMSSERSIFCSGFILFYISFHWQVYECDLLDLHE